MNHLEFIIWMFGFPLVCAAEDVIRTRFGGVKVVMSPVAVAVFKVANVVLWLGIGWALW